MTRLNTFSVGEVVMYLSEYNFLGGVVISVGKKNLKLLCDYGTHKDFKYVLPEKAAHLNENVVVVWEMWKGVNGRGSHRLDFDLYPQYHFKAKDHPYQYHIYEESFSIIDPIWEENNS